MKAEQIVIAGGAQWVGEMGGLVLFRDPVTGSTCSLPQSYISVALVKAKCNSKRREFGVVSVSV